MDKCSKSEAGYVAQPDSNFLCGECTFRKGTHDAGRCAYFAPDVPISYTEGSCNFWKFGHETVPWLKPYYTKQIAGYAESRHGFGCKRCKEAIVEHNDCRKVDKDSPGFTPGIISAAKGCCSLWEKDPARGHLTSQQLISFIGAAPKIKLRATQR